MEISGKALFHDQNHEIHLKAPESQFGLVIFKSIYDPIYWNNFNLQF